MTTCDRCETRHKIQLSTALTLAQAGPARPPVYCFACAGELGLLAAATGIVGNREARGLLGLDN